MPVVPSRTETPAVAGVTGGDGGIPVLTTERLLLRAPSADDLDASAAMWSNPEVVRHIGGKPFTREEVWSRILRARGLWSMLGYGFWAVYRSEGRRVGKECVSTGRSRWSRYHLKKK